MKNTTAFSLLTVAVLFAGELAAADVVHAVVAVHRHGDRTWKGAPPTKLTQLGSKQCFESGQYFRSRYLTYGSEQYINGISESTYDSMQVYALTPDQTLLATSGQAFLQGLYPPKTYNKPNVLADGQTIGDPSGGQQFTILHTVSTTDPNTIWLKSDENCPNYVEQSSQYFSSEEFQKTVDDTKDFYNSFRPLLRGVISDDQIGFQSAYNIFDYFNVGVVHNSSLVGKVSEEDLYQLRVLADRHEVGLNGIVSEVNTATTISGRSLAHKVVSQLDPMQSNGGKTNKFSLLMASYDTFLAFFAHVGLHEVSRDFKGLPDLASAMVFELFTEDLTEVYPPELENLQVRFLFKNGTDAELVQFPIFGQRELSWPDFQMEIGKFSLTNVFEWCAMCASGENYCPGGISSISDISNADTRGTFGEDDGTHPSDSAPNATSGNPLSPAVAGAVGAVAALIVSVLAVGLAMAIFGIRFGKITKKNDQSIQEKHMSADSDMDSVKSIHVAPGKV